MARMFYFRNDQGSPLPKNTANLKSKLLDFNTLFFHFIIP